jgi:hypothetical protein
MTKPITGRCLCGAVQFQFNEAPFAMRACWCRDCQYLAAGNASVSAMFRTEAFKRTGEVGEYVSNADSGNAIRRQFCPKCGTPLFAYSSRRTDIMVVRVGSLDDREIGGPQSVIWTKSAPSWGFVDPDLPHSAGQPAPIPSK